MKYFVCSDIHGFYNEWMKALDEKGFDINNPKHKIIVCGDLFDRGRQPKEIIDFILSHKDKFVLIRGNHEDLMQDMINRNCNLRHDLSNGTAYTMVDLCPEWMITEFDLKKIAKQTGLQEVLDMCVNYFETKNFVFVHGWIPVNEKTMKYNENWRNASKSRWDDARWLNPVEMYQNKVFDPEKTIVCGHWHCSAFWHAKDPAQYEEFGPKANFKPFVTKDMIALDACTAYSKKVNVIVVEDIKVLDKAKSQKSAEAKMARKYDSKELELN